MWHWQFLTVDLKIVEEPIDVKWKLNKHQSCQKEMYSAWKIEYKYHTVDFLNE